MKTQPVTLYKKMERFAAITKTMIVQGNILRAKKCLNVAETLLVNGNNEMKNAVTNVYLYSVSCFIELHNCSIRNLFPGLLKSEYLKQVNASGI